MNSGYSEPPDIVNFLPGPFEFTITRVHCACLTKCRVGQLSEIWDDVLEENNHLNRHQFQRHTNLFTTANINCAHHAVEHCQYCKATHILSSAGIAPTSTNVFDTSLESIHKHLPLPFHLLPFHLLFAYQNRIW